MAAVLSANIYSKIGFNIYFDVRAQRMRVPGGSKFHLEPGTTTTPTRRQYHQASEVFTPKRVAKTTDNSWVQLRKPRIYRDR